MHDSSLPLPAANAAEVERLRIRVDELHGMVRLILLGLIITTTGLCLFMYRQAKLLRYQILAQRETVARAEAAVAPALQMIPRFQRIGGLHPDYASNILVQFGLQALPPSNAAPAQAVRSK
ncbi:MAG: hypothetical protein RIS76_4210 [Verrucomicrobiota bacterium]|jgi:hypothetical protein